MKKSIKSLKNAGFLHAALLTAGAVILILGLTTETAKAPEGNSPALSASPPPAAKASEQGVLVEPGCEIIQTMAFSRCGHSVTRRVTAPETVIGKDFEAVQHYYDLWQIESYAPERIDMRREIPLFCPIHTVAGVNDAGCVVLSRNVYGDGMAVFKDTGKALEDFSQEAREELLLGLGFDSETEAEAWLREH
ncbi:MAG: hypothetical protein IKH57_15295 [Clostridia bacterium]|nr:hypothetical protein [Clostridia bacterium]